MSLSESLNSFTFKLYNAMTNGSDGNFFISPFSISSALSMCYMGARDETATQLKSLLALGDLKDEQIKQLNEELLTKLNNLGQAVALDVANKIYTQKDYTIEKQFSDALQKHMRSEVQLLDFGESAKAAKTINDWVADKTHQKITDLIPADALSALTKLVLVNAIYFKGKWLHPFNKEITEKEDFHLSDGTKVQVDMMRLLSKKFLLQINPQKIKALVCEFPYVGDSVAMTIILPHEGISLKSVEATLNDKVLKSILSNEDGYEIGKVHAYIPRFKLDFKEELSQHLSKLGAPLAFDKNQADFSGINKDARAHQLHISRVIHNAVVEVNEEGTEAAAATAIVMNTYSAVLEAPPEEFRCNRPFMFVIHDKSTNTVLFAGRLMKP